MMFRQNCFDIVRGLSRLDSNTFDGVLSDIPYALGNKQPTSKDIQGYLFGASTLDTGGDFMGADWSLPSVAIWKDILRVMKPGSYALIYAHPRNEDLVKMGMRIAGFEIRDSVIWLFGKSMPKSMNLGKEMDIAAGTSDLRPVIGEQILSGNAGLDCSEKGGTYGVGVGVAPPKKVALTAGYSQVAKDFEGYGTNLKSNYEVVIVARKPMVSLTAEQIRAATGWSHWTTETTHLSSEVKEKFPNKKVRVQDHISLIPDNCQSYKRFFNNDTKSPDFGKELCEPMYYDCEPPEANSIVANALVYGVGGLNINGCRLDTIKPLKINRWNGGAKVFGGSDDDDYSEIEVDGKWPSNVIFDEESGQEIDEQFPDNKPARFFYHTKVGKDERNAGCEHLPKRSSGSMVKRDEDSTGINNGRAGAGRTSGHHNFHPTIKPIDLNTWLATLILPPKRETPRKLLNTYSGSGSEAIGAAIAGWDEIIGIEREQDFVEIAHHRFKYWMAQDAAVKEMSQLIQGKK